VVPKPNLGLTRGSHDAVDLLYQIRVSVRFLDKALDRIDRESRKSFDVSEAAGQTNGNIRVEVAKV
jgi:hypothetical protein